MATAQEQQELVDALKFVPREITVTLYGYGGEVVLGTIDPAVYEYWSQRDDLEDLVHDWDREVDCPDDMRFVEDGAYYDIDDIAHESGVEMSGLSGVAVYDTLEQREIFTARLDPSDLRDAGCDTECTDEIYIHDQKPGTCVFYGHSSEKGTFFEATVRITKPFDPEKLRFEYYDIENFPVCSAVYYNEEELEGTDAYSTNGKGHTYFVQKVPGGDVEVLENEETWSSRVIDESQLTPWFAVTEKPTYLGNYELEFTASTKQPARSMAYWDGHYWIVPDEYQHLLIRQWRGLNKPAQY